jgi:hypothetical protein
MHILTFQNLVNLEYLIIHDCGLAGIDTGTFSCLVNLVHLDLSGNNFLLFDDVSRGLEGFQATTLQMLNISSIQNGKRTASATVNASFLTPLMHSKLKLLDFSWTRVDTINSRLIPFLSHLEVLNGSGRRIFRQLDFLAELVF